MSAKIEFELERLVICHLVMGIMRTWHEHYLPRGEPFGRRLESMFIAMSIGIGHIENKPFSVAKIAAYMNMPRTTVIQRLSVLQKWGLIHRRGLQYYADPDILNSIMGLKCYRQVRRHLQNASRELSKLDTRQPPSEKMAGQLMRTNGTL